jgi:hypothetical protein
VSYTICYFPQNIITKLWSNISFLDFKNNLSETNIPLK